MLTVIKDKDARKVVGGFWVCETSGDNKGTCSDDGKKGVGVGTGLAVAPEEGGTNGPITTGQ